MTQSTEDRVRLIQKLLKKAEDPAVTEPERDAFNAKVTALMIQWGIEEAMLASDDRPVEEITKREFHTDVPKSFSYEYAKIGIRVANALGAHGLYQKKADGRTVTLVVGFPSDLDRIGMLIQSLTLQATLALGAWWKVSGYRDVRNGTARFNAKRSFLTGFSEGLRWKLESVYKQTVASAGHGAELVLVDRTKQIDTWMSANMSIGSARQRRYYSDPVTHGSNAGQRADVGQTGMGNAGASRGAIDV